MCLRTLRYSGNSSRVNVAFFWMFSSSAKRASPVTLVLTTGMEWRAPGVVDGPDVFVHRVVEVGLRLLGFRAIIEDGQRLEFCYAVDGRLAIEQRGAAHKLLEDGAPNYPFRQGQAIFHGPQPNAGAKFDEPRFAHHQKHPICFFQFAVRQVCEGNFGVCKINQRSGGWSFLL